MSGLTDEELAAVKLNAEGLFKRSEGQTAAGELTERVRVTLAPFALGAAQDPDFEAARPTANHIAFALMVRGGAASRSIFEILT